MASELTPRGLKVDLGLARRLSPSTLPTPHVSEGITRRKPFEERIAVLACSQGSLQTQMGGIGSEGGGPRKSKDG